MGKQQENQQEDQQDQQPPIDPAKQDVQLTPDQVQDIVTQTTNALNAEHLAQLDDERKRVAEETRAQVLREIEEEQKANAIKEQDTAKVSAAKREKFPYGNQNKEIDVTQVRPDLKEFPEDKVTVLFPQWNRDSAGKPLSIDYKNSSLQFIDGPVFDANNATNEGNGKTVYDLLALDPIELHRGKNVKSRKVVKSFLDEKAES